MTFDETCKTDAAYAQLSTEYLFKILDLYPSNVLTALEENWQYINLNSVMSALSQPVQSNTIDVNHVLLKVKDTNTSFFYRNQVVEQLEKISTK